MLGTVLTAVVAVLHLYILVLEMFLWESDRGRRAFGTTPDFAKATRVLAANQGLYNGFLAAGLFWGVALGEPGDAIKLFFLGCVAVAGIFGGATASRRIAFIQTVPAVIAGLAVWLT